MHAYRMLGSLDDADDVTQDTLLRVWRSLGRFEQRASLRTWLFRIATNAVLILRDVLSWSGPEVAELLETTLASVNSALQRARATVDAELPDRAYALASVSPPRLRGDVSLNGCTR